MTNEKIIEGTKMSKKSEDNTESWKGKTLKMLTGDKVRFNLILGRDKTGIELKSKDRSGKIEFNPEIGEGVRIFQDGEFEDLLKKRELIDEIRRETEKNYGNRLDPEEWPSEEKSLMVILLKLKSLLSGISTH